MKPTMRFWIGMLIIPFILVGISKPVCGQQGDQLQPFEAFIGTWSLGNSQQVFEWGPGKSSVIAKSYSLTSNGVRALVSHGMWFWHPDRRQIKGYVTANDMPVSFFEYTTEFENGSMISQLSAFDKDGNKSVYREVMQINSDSTYKWTLYRQDEAIMDGIFTLLRE